METRGGIRERKKSIWGNGWISQRTIIIIVIIIIIIILSIIIIINS